MTEVIEEELPGPLIRSGIWQQQQLETVILSLGLILKKLN